MPAHCSQPTDCSLAFAGDVTALCIASWSSDNGLQPTLRGDASASCGAAAAAAPAASVMLAGGGSQLHVFELPSGRRTCCATVLPYSVQVHGIAWLPGTLRGPARRPSLLVAVHGGRHAALLRLLGPPQPAPGAAAADGDGDGWEVQPLAQLPPFQHWTLDASLLRSSGGGDDGLLLAVGLSDNSVQAFSVEVPPSGPACVQRALRAACASRCLLYSLALHHQQEQAQQPGRSRCSGDAGGGGKRSGGCRWLVASGTILRDVLVWATPEVPAASAAGAADTAWLSPGLGVLAEPPAQVAPLYRLVGHEGSIHRWVAGQKSMGLERLWDCAVVRV